MSAYFIAGRGEDFPAGCDSVDRRGNVDIGHELHHDFDEPFPRNAAPQSSADMGTQLRCRGSERRQSRDGDDLARARVQRRILVDFSVDCLQNIGCELRRHVAQRSFALLRRLTKNFCDLLCAASPALRV
jgi:hypothetical protein